MKICVIGNDKRSKKVKKIYKDEIVSITQADYIFCPIPFTRDKVNITYTGISIDDIILKVSKASKGKGTKTIITGSVPKDVTDKLNENNINVIDVTNYEEFNIKNAVATSQGAIKKAIEMIDFTINSSNILILGFGRIGKCLARNLEGFGANIYCESRSNKDIALTRFMGYNEVGLRDLDKVLLNMDIIFNTVPSVLITKKMQEKLKKGVCVIDLASSSCMEDIQNIRKDIHYEWYLSVPSKDTPYSAAMYIKETFENIIRGSENGREDKRKRNS